MPVILSSMQILDHEDTAMIRPMQLVAWETRILLFVFL